MDKVIRAINPTAAAGDAHHARVGAAANGLIGLIKVEAAGDSALNRIAAESNEIINE